jgi:uncharacterized Zn finger protein
MARESAAEKSKRLLIDGRVQVVTAGSRGVRAVVEGDHSIYEVHVTPGGKASCECASYGPCSHAMAVGLVAGRKPGR